MPSPVLILFDLDETLFDHGHSSRTALQELQQRYAEIGAFPLATLEAEAYRILNLFHEKVLAGELPLEQARSERLGLLLDFCGVGWMRTDLDEIRGTYGAAYRASRRSVPGARELLEVLGSSCRLGVVTNNFVKEQEAKLEDCGLRKLIDFMVTSEEEGCRKPEPEIFRRALDRGCATHAETVMVGDSWDVDVLGARRAGIRPIWFNRSRRICPARERSAELESFIPLETAVEVILGV